MKEIKNYIGTSSGSIICFLLAIGYTPIEIMVYICTHQLLERIQHFNVVAMINGGGASSFISIYEQLEKMTIEKIGYIPTFQDLKTKFNANLTCITYNLTENKTEYLSVDNYPNLRSHLKTSPYNQVSFGFLATAQVLCFCFDSH